MSQRVLVTAGAAGIGREIVRAFSEIGAKVFTVDVDADGLASLAEEIPGLKIGVCDMASRSDVERMVPEAVEALGGLDVLVNNAGIAGPTAPVESYAPEAWDEVVRVNLTATFDATRLAIPHLKRSPSGVVIVMSSMAGRLGYPNRSAYSATKWGLVGFTKTLSRELGEFGVRVNAILPGCVAGPRIQKVFEDRASLTGRSVDEEIDDALKIQSLKRLVDPREVAALAVFLASKAARSISGQAISIDNDTQ